MGLIKMLIQKGNYVNEIEFDAVMSEGAKTSSRITQNPVERGADVNDHIIIEPMTFELSGITSNSSIGIAQAGAALDAAAALAGVPTKSQRLWNDLLDLQAGQFPFTLVQGLKAYDNVVIKSLQETQTAENSNALEFSAVFKEMIFVGSIELPAATFLDSVVSDKATPTSSSGLKALGGA